MGLATAQLLAFRGATVSLTDVNEQALSAALESLPRGSSEWHMSRVADVRDSEAVDSWIRATVETLGRLDGAVNMAGVISPACPVAQMSDADWDFNFAVNARGVFSCIRAQVNAMTGGGSIVSFFLFFSLAEIFEVIFSLLDGATQGRIATKGLDESKRSRSSDETINPQVSAASVFGQMGSPGVAGYCASKAAVIGLVRTAAKENPHVRMNCVAPGK